MTATRSVAPRLAGPISRAGVAPSGGHGIVRGICRLVGLGSLAIASACASSQVPQSGPEVAQTSAGTALVDADGMALYTYDRDSAGKSTCTGMCAYFWPPAEAGPDATPADGFSIITRPNGTSQWAYQGAPLYAYVSDEKPGDTKGDGSEGVWHLARP